MNGKHILVAEDSATQAAALRADLDSAGFRVSVARNGAEALGLIARQPPDLVVSDIVMPDVDGYELCRRVKESHPSLPVVLLTSMEDPMDVVQALSAGADNFLRKPYEPTELVHRIGNMLHNKQLRESGRAQMGLELYFLGRRFMINADREQILDLLVSTFEELVTVNTRLTVREEALEAARDDLRRQLAEVERERDRLRAVLAAVPGGMVVFDADCRVVEANAQFADIVGAPVATLLGGVVGDVARLVDQEGTPVPDPEQWLDEACRHGRGAVRGTAFDLFIERADGDTVPVVLRSEPVLGRDGAIQGAVATVEDLRPVQEHDPVTGLPGHRLLSERLTTMAALAAEHRSKTAVVVVVLDRFHQFRERLPGRALDQLLRELAERLRSTLRSAALVQRAPAASAAYLGNGEVAVVLPELASPEDAFTVGQLLVDRLSWETDVEGVRVSLATSAAVGTWHGDVDAPDLISSVAGAARRISRAGGGQVSASDAQHQRRVIDALREEAELRAALEQGQLVVHYQPQLTVRDEYPVGVEALVRWEHPRRGVLGASDVIPVAVDSGLIGPLGWHVLEEACRELAKWSGDTVPALSVNVAAEQLNDPEAPDRISDILERTGFPVEKLVLEITEGSVMDDVELARDRLRRMKALGCRVAIDDFGTGYSSLMQLRDLPVDILKVDRSFVSGMLEDPADSAIVTMVIRLSRALGLEVVAEGVETLDQLVQLRVLGCDVGQGFHWSPALPLEELTTWWPEDVSASSVGAAEGGSAAETDERQDEIISYLVHELRSPLVSISGFADLLLASPDDAPTADFAAAIARNARELDRRLTSLHEVNDLLRGGLTLRMEQRDVGELVGTLVDDMTRQLQPHPVEFTTTGLPLAAIDPDRLSQAVANLITNAGKFSSPEQPIEVSVEGRGTSAVIEVRDHGPGVPPDRRPELFRRFSRLGSTHTGMGLGLYLARAVVEAHGGVIRYDDAPGGGSVFSIRLPLRSAAPLRQEGSLDASEPRSEPSDAGDSRVRSSTILSVEDDDATAEVIARVLHHHDVRRAASARDALSFVADQAPEVILLDRHIGDMHGDELLRKLLADPRTAGVPMIVLTATDDPDVDARLVGAGAYAVLGKPFHPGALRATVAAALHGSPATEPRTGVGRSKRDRSPVLDHRLVEAVEQLGHDSGRGVDDLVRTALAAARQHLGALEEAVADREEEVIGHETHALRGVLGTLGATAVIERCIRLERLASSHDRGALDDALGDLRDAVRDAEQALLDRFSVDR